MVECFITQQQISKTDLKKNLILSINSKYRRLHDLFNLIVISSFFSFSFWEAASIKETLLPHLW